jgi:ATP-binding cassette subfamily B protein/subfamily B ATP-binding cassette protein MsbA
MRHSYRKLLRYPLKQWPGLVAILGLSVLASAVAALQPWPLKLLVDYAFGGSELPPRLQSWPGASNPMVLVITAAVAGLVLYALNAAIEVGTLRGWSRTGQRMTYELAGGLFHRLQRLSLTFHGRREVGDLMSRLSGDASCVYELTDSLLIAPWQNLFTLVAVGAVAWRLDPTLTAVTLLVAPAAAGSVAYFAPRLKERARRDRRARSRLVSFVHQTLESIPVVQGFGTEASNRSRFDHLAEEVVGVSRRRSLVKGVYEAVNGLAGTVGMAIVLWVGGTRVLSGDLSLGTLLVFLAYFGSIKSSLFGLLGIVGRLKTAEASMERVLEVLDSEEGVREAPNARELPVRGVSGHVRLEGVTFGYEPGREVLRGVDLEGRPGETVALVGRTGAGKSTVVSMIPRFFDPWQGTVRLDGEDVRGLRLSSLRQQIALVLQEPFLLPLTVAENIAYGRPGASRGEVEAAARAARAEEFIRALPEGFETVIGERGATLSGGERQRLAIARALLKDAPVLILDEPTAALDAATESELMAALERLVRGRTTFIVAHRLSTVRRADRIVVIEDGRVVEEGTHAELLAARGLYRQMYLLQESEPPREEVA